MQHESTNRVIRGLHVFQIGKLLTNSHMMTPMHSNFDLPHSQNILKSEKSTMLKNDILSTNALKHVLLF